MREFGRLAADIGSHDILWKVTNASAIRAELAGLLGMLHLLFQDLDVSASHSIPHHVLTCAHRSLINSSNRIWLYATLYF